MTTFCADCSEAVVVTSLRVLDATATTTGPYDRLGARRHPNEIARSIRHDRLDGHAAHICSTIPGDRP